jgi:hypothetical protein
MRKGTSARVEGPRDPRTTSGNLAASRLDTREQICSAQKYDAA